MEALNLIARSATGSLRDAENLLQQLHSYYGSPLTAAQARELLGITSDARVRDLARHILARDLGAGLRTINDVTNDGLDLRQFNRELVEYLRAALLVKAGVPETVDLPADAIVDIKDAVAKVSFDEITRAVRQFAQLDMRWDTHTSLPLELALAAYAGQADPDEPAKEAPPQRRPVASPSMERPREPYRAPGEGMARKAEPAPSAVAHKGELPPKPEQPMVGSLAFDYLVSIWKNGFLDQLRSIGGKTAIDAWLRGSCQPERIDDNTVVLGFYHAFHKEKVEMPENKRLVEQALTHVLGAPYQLRCILSSRERKPNPPVVGGGHLVRAVQEMGGRVVYEKEGP
ncbi:MAG: hypothetical protein HY677_05090 [Chloroflexi bacterium]|nr:hypothetical protein [Chloroflexota bacterium]